MEQLVKLCFRFGFSNKEKAAESTGKEAEEFAAIVHNTSKKMKGFKFKKPDLPLK